MIMNDGMKSGKMQVFSLLSQVDGTTERTRSEKGKRRCPQQAGGGSPEIGRNRPVGPSRSGLPEIEESGGEAGGGAGAKVFHRGGHLREERIQERLLLLVGHHEQVSGFEVEQLRQAREGILAVAQRIDQSVGQRIRGIEDPPVGDGAPELLLGNAPGGGNETDEPVVRRVHRPLQDGHLFGTDRLQRVQQVLVLAGLDRHVRDSQLVREGLHVEGLHEDADGSDDGRGLRDDRIRGQCDVVAARCRDVPHQNHDPAVGIGLLEADDLVVDFVDAMEIRKGMIVADRGFPPEAIRAALIGRPDVDYLVPLNRDRKVISDLSLRNYDSILSGTSIACMKTDSFDEYGNTVWYYSYRDPEIASDEETLYLRSRSGMKIDPDELRARREEFGTIVFASNRDMGLDKAHKIYKNRWIIEESFKFSRSELGDDTTDEESDYAVQASQFIDHLASIMATRMRNRFLEAGLLRDKTYGQVYNLLLRLKMTRESDGENWKLRRIADKDAETSAVLGLIIKPIVPVLPKEGKRGRPKGSKDRKPCQKRGKAAGRGLKDPTKTSN